MAAPTAQHRPAPARAGLGIVTPEAVLLEFSEAGLGSRSLAFLVDLGVRAALVYAVVFTLGMAGFVLDETAVVVILIASAFAVVFVYPLVCETIWNGRTPGKMVVGLRVVTIEGAPVRFRHAAIRSALGIVDFVVGAGSVAILCALATRQSQRLGDLAAGTIVIRERQAAAFAHPVVFRPPPGWEAYGASLDVSKLTDEGYILVRSFLLRVTELGQQARRERGAGLAAAVARSIGTPLPEGTDPEAFLITVAAAYQAANGGPELTAPAVARPGAGGAPPPVWHEDQPPATWGTTATGS